jgi:hypothetical protein
MFRGIWPNRKVRRMLVLNRQERLVGILPLGDIALADAAGSAGNALCYLSRPGRDALAAMRS